MTTLKEIYSNPLSEIKFNSLSDNTFIFFKDKYKSLIDFYLNKLVDNNNLEKTGEMNIAIDIGNKDNILGSLKGVELSDHDIFEVVGKGFYTVVLNIVSNVLMTILLEEKRLKKLLKDINKKIRKSKIDKEFNISSLISGSFLVSVIKDNIGLIVESNNEFLVEKIISLLIKKLTVNLVNEKSNTNLMPNITKLATIIKDEIFDLIKNEDITFNLFFENFDIILNSLEFNYQREYVIYNTFFIFSGYLRNINLINLNNFYLISSDILINKDSILKLSDNYFSYYEITPSEKIVDKFLREEILNIFNSFIEFIDSFGKKYEDIKELQFKLFKRNKNEIIKFLKHLYKNYDKDIILLLKMLFKKKKYYVGEEFWKIDNFITALNKLLGINKEKVKINGKTYFVTKLLDKEFPVFKSKYYIPENKKKTFEDILKEIYKRIYLNEIFPNNLSGTLYNLLLLGPTGSGKTFFAKALSDELGVPLARIDGNLLKSDHTFTNITGAPPSYVGAGELNNWQQIVLDINKKGKNGVILIDEIEKAHPSILDLFLQLLDEGKIVLSSGVELDFSKFIVILTSNLIQKEDESIGFKIYENNKSELEVKEKFKDKLLEFFKPEFLGRLDKVEIIPAYNKDDLNRIYDFLVNESLEKFDFSKTKKEEIKKLLKKDKIEIIKKVEKTQENIRILKKEIEKRIINFIII